MNFNALLAAEATPPASGPGFVLLASIVAFNTLIYVVLTVAKLVPWPRQARPSEVRRGVERVGLTIKEESVMSHIPLPAPMESEDPAEDLRLATARHEIPQAFMLSGGLIMSFALVVSLVNRIDFRVHVLEFLIGVGFLIAGVVLGDSQIRGRTMERAWAATVSVLVVLLVLEGSSLDEPAPIAYAVILMTAYMPITLSWPPALSAAAVMLGSTAVITLAGDEDTLVLLLAPSALLVSAALLYLRANAFEAEAVEHAQAAALATTEPLTGLLNRRGLLTQMPRMADDAVRTDRRLFVASLQILDLERARLDYGEAYARVVLATTAAAVESVVRVSDLVAVWPNDEFLVVGLGQSATAAELAAGIEGAVLETGIALGRRPVRIRAGNSDGDPATDTFEQILDAARSARAIAVAAAGEVA